MECKYMVKGIRGSKATFSVGRCPIITCSAMILTILLKIKSYTTLNP
jgi:hypothetical protein